MPGKKGNKNALKHGLYSKAFIKTNALSIEQRKAIIDACIDKMFRLFKSAVDVETASKALNSLALAVTAANNCERTLAIVNGNYSPIDEVLQALRTYDADTD